jgi:hypothetical protein
MTTTPNCPATREAVAELEAEGDTGCTICGRPASEHAPERPPAPAGPHPFMPRLANQPWGLCWCGLAESAHADTVTAYTPLTSRRAMVDATDVARALEDDRDRYTDR